MRIILVGIDGASPFLIEKWMEALPTFRKIKEEGSLGHSIPPIPAQTPVAWTTFMTGKNPGKHGIFSFMMRRKGTYAREIANPSMIKSKSLWQLLSEEGKKVGIINVPMSDTENVVGFMIPGFLSRTEGTPYPDHIKKAIKQDLGITNLTGDVETQILQNVEKESAKFFKRVNQITDETAKLSLFLAQREEWDFFMTVFMGADRIQHFFWKYVDPAHEKFEKNLFSRLVKEYYIKLDGILKSFLDFIDEDDLLIVLSDHGFCPVSKELYLNNYLEELGFLKVKNGSIDPKNSEAFSYGYGDIWLNVKNREPNGLIKPGEEYEKTRSEIINGLKAIKIDGQSPFKEMKLREDIYWGNNLDNAPDLVTIFNVGWQGARYPQLVERHESSTYINETPRWSGGHDGTHDSLDVPGIFGVIGPHVAHSKNQKVNLWDLAPTILNLLHVPKPKDFDGKSLLP